MHDVGQTATGLVAVGRCEGYLSSASPAGTDKVKVREGCFRWGNSGSTDEITIAHIGRTAYVVDDQTVALTDGGGTRSPAGEVVDVDSQGVWIDMGLRRAPLGQVHLAMRLTALDGTATYRLPAPIAGTITRITTILEGALTTGDAVATGKIGAVAITGGAVTITQSGSAAGDVDSVVPTAANVVDVGDDINFTISGTNDASVSAMLVVEITG